jgi:hypothetical protein
MYPLKIRDPTASQPPGCLGSSDLHISMLSNFNVSMRYRTSMKGGKSAGGIANRSPFEAAGKFI